MVTEAERLESINRINILERGEEAVARGDVTQEQFDESLRIFNKTKSMDEANKYLENERKKKHKVVLEQKTRLFLWVKNMVV